MIVLITGKRAMFSRPELKVERYSYDVPTASALIGLLSSIYWKPEMRYVMDKVHVLNEIKFETAMTNAQSTGISSSGESVYRAKYSAPRNMQILRNVAYAVEFHMELTGKGTSPNDCIKKHEAILSQRLRKGQYFSHPYLGCKEFICDVVELHSKDEIPASYYEGTYRSLGRMLHHIEFSEDGQTQVWFNAVMENGVVDFSKDSDDSDGWLFKTLVNFYDRNATTIGLPMFGYTEESVTFCLTLNKEGIPVSFEAISTNNKGKPIPTKEIVPAKAPGRSSNILPNFAWDNDKYVFGIDKKEEFGILKVNSFKDKLLEVLDGYDNDSIRAVKSFYENERNKDVSLLLGKYADSKGSVAGNIAFAIEGEDGFFHNNSLVKEAWSKYYFEHLQGKVINCMVTGEEDYLNELHASISPVVGAKPYAKLICLEQNSHGYENYGWKQMENSPMGQKTAFKYAVVLNRFLSNRLYKVDTEENTFVFWNDSNNEDLQGYLNSLMSGFDNFEYDKSAIPEGENFYILHLKGNGSRIYIKGFEKYTWGEPNCIKSLITMLKENGIANSRNVIWNDVAELNNNEFFTMEDESFMNKSRGYLLGELFSICEKAQKDAVESTKSSKTIADRLMSTASTKPATAFPRILNLAQHHVNKVDYGVKRMIMDKVSELSSFDVPFPDRLDSKEQCDFYVGYNMQCRAFDEERAIRIREKAEKNAQAEEEM